MATLAFKLKTSSAVAFRFSNGRQGIQVLKTIPFKLSPSDIWNNKLQLTDNNTELNVKLIKLKSFILEGVNNSILRNETITKGLILSLYDSFINPQKEKDESPKIIDLIDIYKRDKMLSHSTLPRLITLQNWIIKFKESTIITDIDINWIREFFNYGVDNKYSESTINKQIQLVKQVLTFAENNNLEVNRNAFNFRAVKEKTITHALTEQQLEKIFNLKSLSPALDNSRKLFLIACSTALRVSDLLRVDTFSISDGMMELTAKKTGQNLIIPIPKRIESFIDEVYPIAAPVFNRNIKTICKAAGLTDITEGYTRTIGGKRIKGKFPLYKLISSHTGRRTFCTLHYGQIPTPVIMAISGHTTEKSFLLYIKKPQRHFANELKAYYDNQLQA